MSKKEKLVLVIEEFFKKNPPTYDNANTGYYGVTYNTFRSANEGDLIKFIIVLVEHGHLKTTDVIEELIKNTMDKIKKHEWIMDNIHACTHLQKDYFVKTRFIDFGEENKHGYYKLSPTLSDGVTDKMIAIMKAFLIR